MPRLAVAGTPIYALGRTLHDAGLALANQGDIDRQTIGGAVATGTHGTGVALGNLSSMVRAVRLVLANGELVTTSAEQHPELFAIARLHLGAVGLVTALELQLRPAYRLRERTRRESFARLFPQLDDLVGASRHFEFFWYPHDDQAQVKVIDETTDAAEYPLAAEGSRCAYSYEVLPNHRPHRHTIAGPRSWARGAGRRCSVWVGLVARMPSAPCPVGACGWQRLGVTGRHVGGVDSWARIRRDIG